MQRIAALFGMSDAVWERHANPLSGWTRMPILPILCLIVYFRGPLDGYIWPLLGLTTLWAFINPRAFPPPASTDNWMSKAVMGERVWLNRDTVPIPRHHTNAARNLSILPILGIVPMIWGLIVRDPWATALGCGLTIIAKLWFLDRMVWLYDDMAPKNAAYAAWLK